MSLVDYGSSSSGGDSGPEAEREAVAAAAAEGGGGRRRISPARSRVRKRRGDTVQIPVPELQSDSDDEEPVQKRTVQGSGSGVGLSALLPQPRNLTLKETNRTLLPYSFTKAQKPAGKNAGPLKATVTTTTPSPSAIKAASKNAAKQLARHIMNEDASEEEEEEEGDDEGDDAGSREVSFFSLSDAERPPPGARTELLAGEAPLAGLPQIPAPGAPVQATELLDPLNPADAPLEFNRSIPSASDGGYPATSASPGVAEFAGAQYVEYGTPGVEQGEYYQDYYSGYYQEPDPALAPVPEEELNAFMNDEAFKRLQGKRNRSKEEVSFLEIKGDDQLSGSQQWLIKSLSEEKDMKSFSKRRGEQPTSQQRRKHQITYLIHQAKERELELKNAWSDNRLTKRQTQAKYGF